MTPVPKAKPKHAKHSGPATSAPPQAKKRTKAHAGGPAPSKADPKHEAKAPTHAKKAGHDS